MANKNEQHATLRESPMMAHLLDALQEGTDIGEYGRLVFTMVARFFLDEDEIVALLANQPEIDEDDARSQLMQVKVRGYNPPKRERILAWQKEQEFPICPNPDDPSACNVYNELDFPDEVFEEIDDYWEERAEAEAQ